MSWRETEGWFDDANYERFKKLELPENPLIVECGTFMGKSTQVFKELWPTARIVTCDPHTVPTWLPKDTVFFNGRGTGIKLGLSMAIDLLFIDDDHQYDTIKENFNHFLSRVKHGSYVAFHDYIFPTAPGVKKFVDELGGCDIDTSGEYGLAIWTRP